jgi:hypothetical protein
MPRKSVASHVGEKLTKPSKGGSRRDDHDDSEHNERVGSRNERVRDKRARRLDGRGYEGFEVDDSSWLWGTLFLVAVLFALSPGVLLTLPPGKGGVWMSGQTSTTAAFVHAALLALLFNYI